MEEELLEKLLTSDNLTDTELMSWLTSDTSTESESSVLQGPRMAALRNELNLVVANFIRERAQPILAVMASSGCVVSSSSLMLLTPSRDNSSKGQNNVCSADKRYEYRSPLKKLNEERKSDTRSNNRRKSNRVQLFSESIPESQSWPTPSSASSSNKALMLVQQQEDSRRRPSRASKCTLQDFIVTKEIKVKKGKSKKKLIDLDNEKRDAVKVETNDYKSSLDAVKASELDDKVVDGSYLTKDMSTHTIENNLSQGSDVDSIKKEVIQKCNQHNESFAHGLSEEAKRNWDAFVVGFSNDHDKVLVEGVTSLQISSKKETPLKRTVSTSREKSQCSQALDRLALLYAHFINNCSLPSVMAELELLIELLLLKKSEKTVIEENTWPFLNGEKCVHFAFTVLQQLQTWLLNYQHPKLLDLIRSHPDLKSFERFKNCLDQLSEIEEKPSQQASWKPKTKEENVVFESVRFCSENDGKDTFPDERTFRDFRKQRDNFYALLWKWQNDSESKREQSNYQNSFYSAEDQTSFASKVRDEVLGIQRHPVNISHFCRLFRDQMLTMASDLFFESLQANKKKEEDRLRRLESRFYKTNSHTDSNDEATRYFPGSLRFFHDFVLVSNDHLFLTQLKALLTQQLLAEEEHQAFEIEEEGHVTHLIRRNVVSNIIRLKISARMLGLIVSLPFRCGAVREQQQQSLIALNSKANSQLIDDMHTHLLLSVQNQHLLQTLPWLTDFLCSLDLITLSTMSSQRLLRALVKIYKSLFRRDNLSDSNAFFLLVCLARLFEHPSVPRELFLLCEETKDDSASEEVIEKVMNKRRQKPRGARGFDQFDVLPRSFLHHSCQDVALRAEQLFKAKSGEQRPPTTNSRSISSRRIEVSDKAITRNNSLDKNALQMQLETNFFHNQSQSVLKSVVFVSDRIASKWIRAVNKRVIKEAHEESSFLIAEIVLSNSANEDQSNNDDKTIVDDRKKKIIDGVFQLVVQRGILASFLDKVSTASDALFTSEFVPLCENSLRSLLPIDDMDAQVIDMAVKIALKKTREKGHEWIKNHVTQGFAEQSLRQEVQRQTILFNAGKCDELVMPHATSVSVRSQESVGQAKVSDENRVWPSHLMMKLKNCMKSMLLGQDHCKFDPVSIVEDLQICTTTNDLSELSRRTLAILSVEWSLVAITFEPRGIKSQLLESLVSSLWMHSSLSSSSQQHLLFVLSPKNLVLLNRSKEPQLTWVKFELLLTKLLSSGLVPPLAFEQQCLSILRCQWPQVWLTRLASCLRRVVTEWKSQQKSNTTRKESKFVELVEWIAWICAEECQDEDSFGNLL